MNKQMERLQALVVQLIARLEHEKGENQRLQSQLTAREAELAQTKRRLDDMRRRAESILNSLSRQNNE
ncbi:MAG: hypothetical protein SOR95_07605 [Sutterella sp.]|nr:hypothetical protein [Sutterella sp.]